MRNFYIIFINALHRITDRLNELLPSVLPLEHTMLSQFMLALSSFVQLIAPLIPSYTVKLTWFYLCHHIRLSGGKSLLMTKRLLALCFGLPVNADHANGISPHKPSLSVYNNCCIPYYPQGYQSIIQQVCAASVRDIAKH